MDGYCKKPTCMRTTKAAMRDGLAARCTRDHEHVQLMGSIPGGGGSRSKLAENYRPLLADRIAELMAAPESLEEAYPAIDNDNDGDQNADPEPIHLHRELGYSMARASSTTSSASTRTSDVRAPTRWPACFVTRALNPKSSSARKPTAARFAWSGSNPLRGRRRAS